MKQASLYDLISCLEYKTKLHICVVFLDNFGNCMTDLPRNHAIHSKPFCEHKKSTPDGLDKCFKCRNLALRKAIETKLPFGGHCFNGVYEYCCPVIISGKTVAVIFVGNILFSNQAFNDELKKFENSFELDFPEEQCEKICSIINAHIKLLLKEYSNIQSDYDPLIENIRNYIEEFLHHDISVSQISLIFNYSEKYIGKLFKRSMGISIREYICERRLDKAYSLLENSNMSVAKTASLVGFNSVTYFSKKFKERFLKAPSDCRKIR